MGGIEYCPEATFTKPETNSKNRKDIYKSGRQSVKMGGSLEKREAICKIGMMFKKCEAIFKNGRQFRKAGGNL